MNWIDIYSEEEGRSSAFLAEEKSKGRYLTVTGNLPHNYKFAPKSRHDADKLIAWLKDWLKANKEKTHRPGLAGRGSRLKRIPINGA